jgi:hypothetical protein
VEDSLCGRVKPDAKEIGDCAPKALQISNGPIVESTVIVEVEAAFVVQPALESRQVAIRNLIAVRLPEWFQGLRGGSHR